MTTVPNELKIHECSLCKKDKCDYRCKDFYCMKPPKYFNKKYITARNGLISKAVKYANGQDFKTLNPKNWKDKWNYAFHSKMNELWETEEKEKGGRKRVG